MTPNDVLDLIERLHLAARHPDITEVERYGQGTPNSPGGVAITYRSESQAYIWATEPGRPEPVPHPLPEMMPELKTRATHALKLLVDLLEAAQLEAFTAWRTVAFDGVGLQPCGVQIRCPDGSSVYLRVTAGFGGQTVPPEVDEFPDYRIPDGISG